MYLAVLGVSFEAVHDEINSCISFGQIHIILIKAHRGEVRGAVLLPVGVGANGANDDGLQVLVDPLTQ